MVFEGIKSFYVNSVCRYLIPVFNNYVWKKTFYVGITFSSNFYFLYSCDYCFVSNRSSLFIVRFYSDFFKNLITFPHRLRFLKKKEFILQILRSKNLWTIKKLEEELPMNKTEKEEISRGLHKRTQWSERWQRFNVK